jgi:3D-(3,5/4)-trihydroxycyclohexane-1,2-dione acylhydrolase (decyclizing)
MKTIRLTLAQALVRHLAALRIELDDGRPVPYCGGVWAIFGHGNVAGMGEALAAQRRAADHPLATYRAHNEQGMAHAAVAYAKAQFCQRMMAVTTSIGPGATNLVTAAALAHVNRLPVLLLPGDVFASRAPDPVLQQVEDFHQADVSANDVFRPVTRYFDRLTRPEQLLTALPRAVQVMTDPALCGPVCLALPQDVQAQAFDCPEDFLHPALIRPRRPAPDAGELARAAAALRQSRRPLVIAGGGVLYSRSGAALAAFADQCGVPVAETQAGKGSLPWDHRLNLGAIGVTGSPAANALAREADLILVVGSRLADFTTGSHTLFGAARLLGLNVQPFDAAKWQGQKHGQALVCDARVGLELLAQDLAQLTGGWAAEPAWTRRAEAEAAGWNARVDVLTSPSEATAGGTLPHHADVIGVLPYDADVIGVLPYDADVIGVVRDSAVGGAAGSAQHDIAVCAAGTLPAELHKLWRAGRPGNYHVEYGYSCMGYEIAGGLGVKMARPEAEVIVLVGDGSYLMMNSEIATSVMLGRKLIIVVLDNRGFGCIQRLQSASGGERFNNLLEDCVDTEADADTDAQGRDVKIDFAAHARSLGADAVHVADLPGLKLAMQAARAARSTQVVVIDTTHTRTTDVGGCWWEVAIPEVSQRAEVNAAHALYLRDKQPQRR